MPKYKVILLTEAWDNLRQIARAYKAKVGPQSAKRITDRILTALRRLEDFPTLGTQPPYERLSRAGYRMLLVDEYLCFYSIKSTEIHIVHIIHGSADYMKRLHLLK